MIYTSSYAHYVTLLYARSTRVSVGARAFQRDLLARRTEPTHHGRFRVHYKADLDSAHSSEQVTTWNFFIAPLDKDL